MYMYELLVKVRPCDVKCMHLNSHLCTLHSAMLVELLPLVFTQVC